MSKAFTVLPNSAALVTDDTKYFDGELIGVTYTMNEKAHNLEGGLFARIALLALNISDYSVPPASRWTNLILVQKDIVTLSSINLPFSNTKYKAVMIIKGSNPLRILGITRI